MLKSLSPLALAALLLAGQLGSFAHLVLVRHVTCPEHGELIHADEAAARPAVVLFADRALRASEPTADHGHDHCFFAAPGRERLLAPQRPAGLSASPQGELRSGVAPRAETTSSVALLRLAPKSSPPV